MTRQVPGDGIDQVRGSIWLLAAAMALVAVALLLLVRPLLGARATEAARDTSAEAAAPARDGTRGDQRRHPVAPPGSDTRPARPVPRGQVAPPPQRAAAAGDVAPADRAAPADAGDADAGGGEEPSGIALFPPPGTNPPKPGIIVPDDFELPPGYVRHHQVTDDGRPLPPILMFHPDFDWVDANGHQLELPADHVVPADLAPPGMPIQMLDVPDTHVDAVEPPPPGAEFEPADPDR
ncbi:MAG TPA: hypothetical protein VL049_12760 [Candidatus Dormibacteraeota bacterium]|nr:hypothetical protein [Candidatus Dormibacteraeota bacterium]